MKSNKVLVLWKDSFWSAGTGDGAMGQSGALRALLERISVSALIHDAGALAVAAAASQRPTAAHTAASRC
jgi:hypothetical protein